jgi:hypothetical protein
MMGSREYDDWRGSSGKLEKFVMGNLNENYPQSWES